MAMHWKQLLCKERPRPSTNPGGSRAEFERDFDRAIFSNPVKRLQDKTQVFPLEPNDAVRTRLTHSLEVSSVARGLGIAVGKNLLDKKLIEAANTREIEAICATCGLIHDLGNPPFGHSGEDAIRYWFETRFKKEQLLEGMGKREQLVQDFLKFEGNAQSLRLLTKLQILADFNGLNLTYGTLSASCKYIAQSNEVDKTNHATSKPGYFASENTIIETIQDNTGTGKARNPLTYLVEAADDIVYSVADIEDAVKKNLIQWKFIEKQLEQKKEPCIIEALDKMKNILKAGTENFESDLPGDIFASAFRTATIGVAVSAVVDIFEEKYDMIMNGEYTGELIKHCSAAKLIEALKEIGRDYVYCASSNLKLELMGRRVICDLMDIFWEGAKELPADGHPNSRSFSGKAGALLSHNYRRVFENSMEAQKDFPEEYHRLHLVTDYVCGMTDTFAKRLHAELTNG